MKYLFVLLFLVSSFAFADQQYKTHRVSRGETVESIAKEYGVTANDIYKLNPDARRGVSPNSTLIIPERGAVQEQGMSFTNHKVRQKETLYSISREYNVSIDEIKRYNKFLYSEPLRRGDRLRIPQSSGNQQEPQAAATSQASSNTSQNANATREHTVLPKETMYGIAREYGLTVEELQEMNPWVENLQPGMMLSIELKRGENNSSTEASIDTTSYRVHEVQPQETFYSLTRQYNISRDSLVRLNPDLREGLKAGMQLRLPKEQQQNPLTPDHYSISENLEYQINNTNTKRLALMLPFNLEKIEIDSVSMAKDRIRRDQVLQISLDFYSGVLLAIDSAKSRGISVDLRVFDSKQNASQIMELIRNNDFSRYDAVIGPLVQDPLEAAARQLSSYNVPVVSPFSTRDVRNLENFVQTRPTKEIMENAVINYLRENSQGRNIVIIAENAEIKRKLREALPTAQIVDPKAGGVVSANELSAAMNRGAENWVVVETNSVGLLSSLTSRLNSMRDTYNISLFTTERTKAFESDNVSNRHLANLKFHYPSVDKEYDVLRNRDFIASYRELYGMDPSQYAVRGFDITYDMLLRMAAFDSVMESFRRFNGTTEYAENKFSYQKMSDGGYYNTAVYILRYDNDLNRRVVR